MSIFSDVSVTLDFHNNKYISWKLKPSFKRCGGYFVVEWAGHAQQFERISKDPVDETFFVWDGLATVVPDRDTYYRVGYVDQLKDCIYYSDPVREGVGNLSDLDKQYIKTILHRLCLTLENYSGVKGVVMHRRCSGELCPHCTDKSVYAQEVSYCPYCEGTGYVGGYYPPIDMTLQLNGHPGTDKDQSPTTGSTIPNIAISAEGIAYPWVCKGDIWVSRNTNDRFLIEGVTPKIVYKDMMLSFVLKLIKQDKAENNILNSTVVNYKVADQGDETQGHPAWDGVNTSNYEL